VELGKRDVASHLDAPPDGWVRAAEGHLDLVYLDRFCQSCGHCGALLYHAAPKKLKRRSYAPRNRKGGREGAALGRGSSPIRGLAPLSAAAPFWKRNCPVCHRPARGAVFLDRILIVELGKFVRVDEKRPVTTTGFTGEDVHGHWHGPRYSSTRKQTPSPLSFLRQKRGCDRRLTKARAQPSWQPVVRVHHGLRNGRGFPSDSSGSGKC